MSLIRISTFLILTTLSILCWASESDEERKWEKCTETALSNYDQNIAGITGGNQIVIEECGLRPVIETDSGLQLLSSDCEWLYKQSLKECSQHENKALCKENDDMLLVSMSSWRGFWSLSKQIFNQEKFFNLCRKVCLDEPIPNKKDFTDSFCKVINQ